MEAPSSFQIQYPLSPRKFWKKFYLNPIGYLIVSIIFGTILGFVTNMLPQLQGTNDVINVPSFMWISILYTIIVYIVTLSIKIWYIKAYIRRYYYDCGEEFITIKKGVFAPTEIHVQYQKIQDVYVDQDIVDRIMGLYDVHIASATVTSGIEAHIDGVNKDVAESLKNIILRKIHDISTNQSSQTQQDQTIQQSPIQFEKKISSETYPISGSWIISAILSSFIFAVSYTIVLVLVSSEVLLSTSVAYIIYALFFVCIFLLRLVWVSVWKNNFYFEFVSDYILLRSGVIAKQENHLPYTSIQNILNNQSLIDRIIGLSTITIQNASSQVVGSGQYRRTIQGGISLVWQPKQKADELTTILNDIVSKINPQNRNNMMGL